MPITPPRSEQPPARPPRLPGEPTRVGRHRVVSVLGRGGMGVVFRAHDEALRREVAIKMVLGGGLDAEDRARFQREARIGANLRHPGIVGVHEVGEHEGRPYIVMDLVHGESVEDVVVRLGGRLPPRRAAELVRETALALAHAHAAGVMHRDVKPQNILVDREGHVRLTDFGLAAIGREKLSTTGDIIGTPAYMSPEQAVGDRAAQGPLCDVWGLGAVLYRCIAGRPPFDGPVLLAVIQDVLTRRPPRLEGLAPDAPPELCAIAMRCLEREPARRYASAAALADDLGRFLAAEAAPVRPPASRDGAGRRLSRVGPRIALGLGAAAALLVAIAVGILVGRRAERERPEPTPPGPRASAPASAAGARAPPLPPPARPALAALIERGLAGRVSAAERDDALAELTRRTDAASAAAIAAALGQIAGQLREAARAACLDLLPPARRAAAGDAVEALLARPLDPGARADLAPAVRRVQTELDRALQARADARPSAPRHLVVHVADAQGEALGAGRLAFARLCCRALGRLGADARSEAAVDALGAYLVAEHDPNRAAEAGRGLLRAAGADGLRRVLGAAEHRFGFDGPFWRLARAWLDERPSVVLPLRDDSAGEHRRQGELHLRLGRWDAAIDAFARALERDPDDVVALVRRAEALGARGDVAAGDAELARALERDPDHVEAIRARALVLESRGEVTGALALMDRAVALDRDDPISFRTRAVLRLVTGQPDAAEADLTRAIEVEPFPYIGLRSRAHLRLERRDAKGALADATRLVEIDPGDTRPYRLRARIRERAGDVDGAIEDVVAALAIDPDAADDRKTLARLRERRGDLEGAIEECTRALARMTDPAARADALVQRASIHLRRRDLDASRADLARAIELAPTTSAVAHRERGLLRAQLGDMRGARAELDRAVELSSLDPRAFVVRGDILGELGDLDGARADYTRALELAPDEAAPWVGRGRVLRAMGEYEAAIADLDRAVAIDPRQARAWIELGVCHGASDRLDRSRAAFDRAVSLDPRAAGAWSGRAVTRLRQGDRRGAVADFRASLEVDPSNAVVWARLAGALRTTGDARGALEAADRALEIAPRLAFGHLARATARAALGDRDGAIADFERCIQLAPDSSEARSARESLARLRGR